MNDHEFRVEITATARADISREIRRDWDGREQGGALVGQFDGDRIVVSNAGGLGIGVSVPRGNSWVRARVSRQFDFAQACGADLAGSWHSHPGGTTTNPSQEDVAIWQATRRALEVPALVGLILMPRQVRVVGLQSDELAWSFREPEVGEYLITDDGCHRTRFVLTGSNDYERSAF